MLGGVGAGVAEPGLQGRPAGGGVGAGGCGNALGKSDGRELSALFCCQPGVDRTLGVQPLAELVVERSEGVFGIDGVAGADKITHRVAGSLPVGGPGWCPPWIHRVQLLCDSGIENAASGAYAEVGKPFADREAGARIGSAGAQVPVLLPVGACAAQALVTGLSEVAVARPCVAGGCGADADLSQQLLLLGVEAVVDLTLLVQPGAEILAGAGEALLGSDVGS